MSEYYVWDINATIQRIRDNQWSYNMRWGHSYGRYVNGSLNRWLYIRDNNKIRRIPDTCVILLRAPL